MLRRDFVAAGAAVAVTSRNGSLLGTFLAHRESHVSVDFDRLLTCLQLQECPLWCWAASMSTIFGFAGHPVDQKKIVNAFFPGLSCQSAGSNYPFFAGMTGVFTDDARNRFQSAVTAAYAPDNKIYTMNPGIVVNELANGRPLIYCNYTHAMVLGAVDFFGPPATPVITRMYACDPFPTNPRTAVMVGPQIQAVTDGGQMRFLAAIMIG